MSLTRKELRELPAADLVESHGKLASNTHVGTN